MAKFRQIWSHCPLPSVNIFSLGNWQISGKRGRLRDREIGAEAQDYRNPDRNDEREEGVAQADGQDRREHARQRGLKVQCNPLLG